MRAHSRTAFWGVGFTTPLPLTCARRHQASLDDLRGRATAGATRKTQNPLAPKSPSIRNIAVPDAVHARRGSADVLTAEALKRRAQRALALQLKKNVLWEGAVVDSATHHVAQHILNLRTNAKYRRSRKMLIAGGALFIRELCAAGQHPKHLVVPSDCNEIPEWVNRHKTEVVRMDRSVMDDIAPGTDGFVGDFDMPPPPPKEHLIANKQRMERVLVLDNVDDAGQLGTLIRTAAAFTYDAVFLVNHCADLYDTKVVQAARGAQFQEAVPIYQLREEDGDDAVAMIRHVIERNHLAPLCFSPSPQPASHSPMTPQDEHMKPGRFSADVETKSLANFCLDEFSQPPAKSSSAGTQSSTGESSRTAGGHILFAGPDHKGNLLTRALKSSVSSRRTKPMVMLSMDDESTNAGGAPSLGTSEDLPPQLAEPVDFVTTLSCVLYALRPSGDWEYLPASYQSPPSATALLHKSKVDIGADRLLPVRPQDLSLSRDEQVAAGHLLNEMKKAKRLQGRRRTDYSHWMKAEAERITEMAKRDARRAAAPWLEDKPMKHRGASGLSDEIPNIINDYRQNLDRDVLREEREDAESYVRPSNYDSKIVRGGAHHGKPRKPHARL